MRNRRSKRSRYNSNLNTLKLISKQWCDINDLMKITGIGKNNAIKLRNQIKQELLNKGYQKINNELWIQYLKNILRNNNVNSSIDEAFNKEINNNRINL